MSFGLVRIMTFFVVTIFCVPTMVEGWKLVALSWHRWITIGESHQAVEFQQWISDPEQAPDVTTGKSNLPRAALRDRLLRALSRSPLSGKSWLYLCEYELTSGERLERVVQTLSMSVLTAPNESYLMPMRAFLAISLWELLPSERRVSTANDLIISARLNLFRFEQGNPDRSVLLALMKAKTERTRQEIREQLEGSVGLEPWMMSYLGFSLSTGSPRAK